MQQIAFQQKLEAAYYSIHPAIRDFKSRQQFINWATDPEQPNSLIATINRRFNNDMTYAIDLCLTRIDPTQPYSETNCAWKTRDEISSVRPNTRKIYYKNNSYTISEFCEKFGIKLTTMRSFVYRHGVDYVTEADIDAILAKQRAKDAVRNQMQHTKQI